MLRSTAIVYTAREMTRTSQNQRGDILDLLHPHPPSPRTGPLQTIPHSRARGARLVSEVAGAGMERGQIEPCINSLLANPASGQELSFKSRNTSLIEFDHIFIFCLSDVNDETIILRVV